MTNFIHNSHTPEVLLSSGVLRRKPATDESLFEKMARNCASRPHWEHVEFCWTLENFWELRALASIGALEESGGDVLWSRPFGDKRRGLWQLKIYPYGDNSITGKGHVSVFLSLDPQSITSKQVYAIFGCFVLDAEGRKSSGRSFTRQKFAEGSASWGWSQFIKADDQTLMHLVNKDALAIKCEIDVFSGVKDFPSRQLEAPLTLKEDVTNFLCSQSQRNVQFTLNGKPVVKTNESLLKARCQTLRRALTVFPTKNTDQGDVPPIPVACSPRGDTLDWSPTSISSDDLFSVKRKDNAVEMEVNHSGVTEAALKDLVEFLESDSCTLLANKVAETKDLLGLLTASAIFGFTALKVHCSNVLLGKIISVADAKLILAVAHPLGFTALSTECHSFLQHAAPQLQGQELIKLILPTSASGSSNAPVVSTNPSRAPTRSSTDAD